MLRGRLLSGRLPPGEFASVTFALSKCAPSDLHARSAPLSNEHRALRPPSGPARESSFPILRCRFGEQNYKAKLPEGGRCDSFTAENLVIELAAT